MFTVTFYSYKGGVGRTLALMNVADRLAQRGKKVFILDFDLEAPGVDSFPGSPTPLNRGLVEYLGTYVNESKVPPISEYVYELPARKDGHIFVMPAGQKDHVYQKLLSQIDLKVLYSERQGYLVVENLKAAIKAEYKPDYLLVDSRTGLTDISGVCTVQLPDLVVMLFNLNWQNINGTAHIFKAIKNNSIGRKIETLLVATPIPDVPTYLGIRKERLATAQKTIGGSIDAVLPFEPFVSFQEAFVPSDAERSYLGISYDDLTEKIIAKNAGDSVSKLAVARKLRDLGDIESAISKYQELVYGDPGFVEGWKDLGQLSLIQGDLEAASRYTYNALELEPSNPSVLTRVATLELRRSNWSKADELFNQFLNQSSDPDSILTLAITFMQHERFNAAKRGFEQANELEEREAANHHLGRVLMALNQPEAALNAFRRAYELLPTSLGHAYNYAYVLGILGHPESTSMYEKVISLYETNPDDLDGVEEANVLQAMSHAYLATGQRDKAMQSLKSALSSATSSEKKEKFFSSIQYRDIPRNAFIQECQSLLLQLDPKALSLPSAGVE
jgi:tetratricopeptide (TPR) repeat protein